MPASPLATPTRSQRALVLLGMLALLFSLLLRVDGEGRVVLPLLELHLPGACWLQRFLPAGCPGCGLTRSFISVSHGRMVQAFRFHAAGPLLYLGLLVFLGRELVQLLRVRSGRPPLSSGRLTKWPVWGLCAVLLAQWLYRLSAG